MQFLQSNSPKVVREFYCNGESDKGVKESKAGESESVWKKMITATEMWWSGRSRRTNQTEPSFPSYRRRRTCRSLTGSPIFSSTTSCGRISDGKRTVAQTAKRVALRRGRATTAQPPLRPNRWGALCQQKGPPLHTRLPGPRSLL